MTTIALIGGIGCGKSTVTDLLCAKGAAVVDADVVAREVVEPGSSALEQLVRAFGDEILHADRTLDRAALAAVAFAQPAATTRMNEILHPAIGVELARQVREAQAATDVVVVAIPLYRPEHRALLDVDLVVCVDCETSAALDRLVAGRGFTEEDAKLRMAAQGPQDERLELADEVLDNSGSREYLSRAVDELWERVASR